MYDICFQNSSKRQTKTVLKDRQNFLNSKNKRENELGSSSVIWQAKILKLKRFLTQHVKLLLKRIRFKADFENQNSKYFQFLDNTLCLRQHLQLQKQPQEPQGAVSPGIPSRNGKHREKSPFQTSHIAGLTLTSLYPALNTEFGLGSFSWG